MPAKDPCVLHFVQRLRKAREGGGHARTSCLRFTEDRLHRYRRSRCAPLEMEDGMRFQRRELLRTLSFAFGSSFIWSGNQLDIGAQAAIQPKVSPRPEGAAVRDGISGGTEMEKVSGIGGFFFRAKDPKAMALWYQQHLGISVIPTSYEQSPWQQEAGSTAFTPFPETSKYFGDPQKVWMLNFRVRDVDKMAVQLRAAGIEVKVDPESYPY